MLSRGTWIGIAAVCCIVLVGLYAARRRSSASHTLSPSQSSAVGSDDQSGRVGGTAESASGSAGAAARSSASGTAAATVPPSANAPNATSVVAPSTGTAAIAAPTSGVGAMPYRTAKVLRFSDAPPATSGSGDSSSPVLQRIFEVAKPDDEQKTKIVDLWRAHEDARRALLATAPQRLSGPPIIDPAKLGPVDFAFESTLLTKVLRPDQRDRLVPQLYPQVGKR